MSVAILLLLSIGFAGCSDDEKTNEQIKPKNVYYSGCKTSSSNAKSTNGFLSETEIIALSAKKGGWLLVDHKNIMCNCCTEKILVNISTDKGVILVDIDEDEHSCNCVCPFDISYEIGELEKTTYTLIIRKGGLEILKENFIYNDDFIKTFTIE